MNRVGPYEITGELGRGGMGVVYRARRDGADHDVALKVIGDGPSEGPSQESLARFQREARIAQELDHPGIVKVLEVGEHEGLAWFAMELVEGEPLSQQIREREFTWQEAVTIVRDVADALAVAHAKGVLHRDIKPSNILIDGAGSPHLTDFGLAKDTRTDSKYTRTGETLGTPSYMSPEQARGDLAQLRPATDVWALGCVLHELLAGRCPFEGETPGAIIGHVITGTPDPLGNLHAGLPAGVAQLAEACLAKAPAERPADAAALRADLERVLAGGRPLHRPRKRKRGALVALAAVLLLAAGIAGVMWPADEPAPVPESRAVVLARQGWEQRLSDPAAGAELVGEALTLEAGHPEWRMQHGLLLWAAGHDERAHDAWAAIPDTAPEWRRAQLFRALCIAFGNMGTPAIRECLPFAAEAATDPGDTGRMARGLQAFIAKDRTQAMAELEDVRGWDAALLRALVTGEHEPARALREYNAALQDGLRFGWALTNRGIAKQSLGDYAGALDEFEEALAVDPRRVAALVGRGVARLERGDAEGGLADLNAALAVNPRSVPALNNRAVARKTAGDIAGALADYTAVLAADPDNLVALFNRARAREETADNAGALRDLDVLLRLTPGDIDALDLRAELRVREGDYRGALADYHAIRAIDSTHLQAAFNAGAVRISLGDLKGALAEFETVLAADPRHRQALRGRAVVRDVLGDHAGALADLNTALDLDGNDPEALTGRARIKVKTGDASGALDDLNAALSLAPRNVKALLERGKLRNRRKALAEAMADFDAVLAIDPRNDRALYNRGIVLGRMSRHTDSLAAFDALLAVHPKHLDGLLARGQNKIRLKDEAGALEDFTALLRIAPDHVGGLVVRGSLRIRLKDTNGALADLSRALELEPHHINGRFNRAVLFFNGKEWARAAADLAVVLERAPRKWPQRRAAAGALQRCREELAKQQGGK